MATCCGAPGCPADARDLSITCRCGTPQRDCYLPGRSLQLASVVDKRKDEQRVRSKDPRQQRLKAWQPIFPEPQLLVQEPEQDNTGLQSGPEDACSVFNDQTEDEDHRRTSSAKIIFGLLKNCNKSQSLLWNICHLWRRRYLRIRDVNQTLPSECAPFRDFHTFTPPFKINLWSINLSLSSHSNPFKTSTSAVSKRDLTTAVGVTSKRS